MARIFLEISLRVNPVCSPNIRIEQNQYDGCIFQNPQMVITNIQIENIMRTPRPVVVRHSSTG